MEQLQRKTAGEGLSNRGVVSEDRISELPEDLLLDILSSLPTKTAIATSVFSKSWKSLWKLLPNLEFDSDKHYHIRTFSEYVSRTLILHKAPVLESLHLAAGDECRASKIGLWIDIAFARHVRQLVLDVFFEEGGSIRFPSALYRCNNTLEVLELRCSILLDVPSLFCFKSLRKLYLYHVIFKDEESVSNLFCGCPCLEDLVMARVCKADVGVFTIAVPSLQRLTLKCDYYGDDDDGGYVINAPSLRYLNINGLIRHKCCLIANAPKLVEAIITKVSYIKNENILESLTAARRISLDLSPLEIKYPIDKSFYQLLFLELHTNKEEWCNLLSLMLNSSPKLQILKLIDSRRQYLDKDKLVDRKWNQPKCVPECLLFHLETFVWTRYEWQREEEHEVATYILKNARRLKKATLSTYPIEPKELEKLEKRREMLNELASVVRASNSCHLLYEADTYSF